MSIRKQFFLKGVLIVLCVCCCWAVTAQRKFIPLNDDPQSGIFHVEGDSLFRNAMDKDVFKGLQLQMLVSKPCRDEQKNVLVYQQEKGSDKVCFAWCSYDDRKSSDDYLMTFRGDESPVAKVNMAKWKRFQRWSDRQLRKDRVVYCLVFQQEDNPKFLYKAESFPAK